MSLFSIEVFNVSKSYKLYNEPKDRLKEALHPFRKTYHSNFHALSDVSLKIKSGETFALVGKNGAGKSTLLKILNGIINPSSGTVLVKGKIVALLELGAGFNPEMTGHENIFLFGALHGYSKEEMESRFSRIVEFADIGEFIEQPVKIYSSGMFVRLAFACSINLEPDVLIVDEALSVGDIRFQRKCFKKIEDLKKNGTTIVLVSHDITLVKMVADRACLIDNGKILSIGEPKDIAIAYFDLAFPADKKSDAPVVKEAKLEDGCTGYADFQLGEASFGERHGGISRLEVKTNAQFPLVEGGEEVVFRLHSHWDVKKIDLLREKEVFDDNIILGVSMSDKYGNYVFGMTTIDKNVTIKTESGKMTAQFKVTLPFLKSDDYLINVSMALGTQEHHTQVSWYESVCAFNCRSSLKNVYGLIYQNYTAEIST